MRSEAAQREEEQLRMGMRISLVLTVLQFLVDLQLSIQKASGKFRMHYAGCGGRPTKDRREDGR
jgi:hypothetical protein